MQIAKKKEKLYSCAKKLVGLERQRTKEETLDK